MNPAGTAAGDVRLAKFDPLPRVLFFDDFDEGINGWCELCGNHDNNLDNIRPLVRDLRPAQLSTCTFFDIGTHGSFDGVYSLKLATRPRVNHMNQLIKRVSLRQTRAGAAGDLVHLQGGDRVRPVAHRAEAVGRQLPPGGGDVRRLRWSQSFGQLEG